MWFFVTNSAAVIDRRAKPLVDEAAKLIKEQGLGIESEGEPVRLSIEVDDEQAAGIVAQAILKLADVTLRAEGTLRAARVAA